MNENRPFFSNLKCRECGRLYAKEAIHICEFDFGPLEAAYDYDAIKSSVSREIISSRPQSMWRYREFLPIDGAPTVGTQVGFTPLVRANRLAKALGVQELYIKNDTVNYPTLSFKDRVVSVALSRARELGFQVVACASTGNLANSVAANAASRRTEELCPHPRGPREEQGARLARLRHECHRHSRSLRPGEPPLLGDRGQVRLGLQ